MLFHELRPYSNQIHVLSQAWDINQHQWVLIANHNDQFICGTAYIDKLHKPWIKSWIANDVLSDNTTTWILWNELKKRAEHFVYADGKLYLRYLEGDKVHCRRRKPTAKQWQIIGLDEFQSLYETELPNLSLPQPSQETGFCQQPKFWDQHRFIPITKIELEIKNLPNNQTYIFLQAIHQQIEFLINELKKTCLSFNDYLAALEYLITGQEQNNIMAFFQQKRASTIVINKVKQISSRWLNAKNIDELIFLSLSPNQTQVSRADIKLLFLKRILIELQLVNPNYAAYNIQKDQATHWREALGLSFIQQYESIVSIIQRILDAEDPSEIDLDEHETLLALKDAIMLLTQLPQDSNINEPKTRFLLTLLADPNPNYNVWQPKINKLKEHWAIKRETCIGFADVFAESNIIFFNEDLLSERELKLHLFLKIQESLLNLKKLSLNAFQYTDMLYCILANDDCHFEDDEKALEEAYQALIQVLNIESQICNSTIAVYLSAKNCDPNFTPGDIQCYLFEIIFCECETCGETFLDDFPLSTSAFYQQSTLIAFTFDTHANNIVHAVKQGISRLSPREIYLALQAIEAISDFGPDQKVDFMLNCNALAEQANASQPIDFTSLYQQLVLARLKLIIDNLDLIDKSASADELAKITHYYNIIFTNSDPGHYLREQLSQAYGDAAEQKLVALRVMLTNHPERTRTQIFYTWPDFSSIDMSIFQNYIPS